MPLIENVEKKIETVEHFKVAMRHAAGRNIRGDKGDIPMYHFSRMARNSITIATWKDQRFKTSYPGFDVDVLDRAGKVVAGNTLLSSVRATYDEK